MIQTGCSAMLFTRQTRLISPSKVINPVRSGHLQGITLTISKKIPGFTNCTEISQGSGLSNGTVLLIILHIFASRYKEQQRKSGIATHVLHANITSAG